MWTEASGGGNLEGFSPGDGESLGQPRCSERESPRSSWRQPRERVGAPGPGHWHVLRQKLSINGGFMSSQLLASWVLGSS